MHTTFAGYKRKSIIRTLIFTTVAPLWPKIQVFSTRILVSRPRDLVLRVIGPSNVLTLKKHSVNEFLCCKRLIGEIAQSRRRPLLGPSPGWKRLLPLSHLRHYAKWTLTPQLMWNWDSRSTVRTELHRHPAVATLSTYIQWKMEDDHTYHNMLKAGII